jgi:trehalose 6-phosphate phosphatase
VEDRLAALSLRTRVRLVLVSGRSARELRGLLPADIEVEIWGSHGRELLRRDGNYKLFALNARQQADLDRFHEEMAGHGLKQTLEVKPSSIAVHWRSVDPATQQRIRATVESTFSGLGETDALRLLPFDGGVELRSIDRTKGTAVLHILGQEGDAVPAAYLGDDLTDEDAFRAVGDAGISILVRSEPRPSASRFWLRPPEELICGLPDLPAKVSHRGASRPRYWLSRCAQRDHPGHARGPRSQRARHLPIFPRKPGPGRG